MDAHVILKEHNIKNTVNRRYILEVLLNSDDAITVENIHEKVIALGTFVNLSTVYRALELFNECNIVEKYDLNNGRYSYKLRSNGHVHTIKCDKCESEITVDCPMNQIEELIKNKTGFTITNHEIYLKGLCNKCKNIK